MRISDLSSDVFSSYLRRMAFTIHRHAGLDPASSLPRVTEPVQRQFRQAGRQGAVEQSGALGRIAVDQRVEKHSEERRDGEEGVRTGRSAWSPEPEKKKYQYASNHTYMITQQIK